MSLFIPLSGNQHKKLRGEEREAYETRLAQYNNDQRLQRKEEYDLSNARLRDRIDELEQRIAALESK